MQNTAPRPQGVHWRLPAGLPKKRQESGYTARRFASLPTPTIYLPEYGVFPPLDRSWCSKAIVTDCDSFDNHNILNFLVTLARPEYPVWMLFCAVHKKNIDAVQQNHHVPGQTHSRPDAAITPG
ncbi:MAG: hypothetical protein ACTSU0_00055 [Alphaproteobacteria bacterium]